MSLADDVARLAQATATLLASEAEHSVLRGGDPPVALTCRDAVLLALRGLAADVSAQAGPPPQRDLARTAEELRGALDRLPLVTAGGMPLREALARKAAPVAARWQEAARSGALLERHRGSLHPTEVLGTAAALAELAAALPALDSDLTAALPTLIARLDPALTAREHHDVTAAAGRLRTVSATLTAGHPEGVDVPLPSVPRVRALRSVQDAPNATRHLAVLLQRRGEDLTLLEVRAAVRVLSAGNALAARLLPAVDVSPPVGARPFYELQNGVVATLGRPAPAVLALSREVREQLLRQAQAPLPPAGINRTGCAPPPPPGSPQRPRPRPPCRQHWPRLP